VRSSIIEYFERHSPEMQGSMWMLTACFWFAVTAALVRYLTFSLDPSLLVFLRNFCALLFFVPWLMRSGFSVAHTTRLPIHVMRSLSGVIGMCLWFFALAELPLNTAMSLTFTTPHFTVLLAIFLLGESVGWHRWFALASGFVGVLIILRPGLATVEFAAIMMVFATFFWAITNILIKKMTVTESPKVIVFYMTLFMTLLSLPFLFIFWEPIGWDLVPWLLFLGWASNQAHGCLAKAYIKIDISAAQTLDFSRLIFTSVLAYIFFAEVLDVWVLIGALVIFVSSLYVVRLEVKRRVVT